MFYLMPTQSKIRLSLNLSKLLCSGNKIKIFREMSTIFSGIEDIHNGIIINSKSDPCNNASEFTARLQASLKNWERSNKRAVWFEVNVNHSFWIPILAEHGFSIHHGVGETVTMVRWLPKDEINRIPIYAHTMIGAGAVVLSEDGEKLLTVRERYRELPYWKLPGGYVEAKEGIAEAAIREVLEETSIRTEFEGLVAFRHSFNAAFGCSDIYFLVHLKPLNNDIVKEDEEVEEVVWMKIAEFLNHPQVHELNRNIIRKFLQLQKNGINISKENIFHPITGKKQHLYGVISISDS